MNHKQKREMEKKLGLLAYRKKLPRAERFELIRQNIIAGKKKEAELKGEVVRQENKADDDAKSNQIASLATTLMITEGLSYIDALEKAKIQLEKE
jgi:hypothetical protein